MLVLGVETSCDETSAAVVADGCEVRSNVVDSQVALHRPYGGVVPEIASRSHVERLPAVLDAAMAQAGVAWPDVDAVAATYGPGLASSLLVGLSCAKGVALRLGRPLIGINHIEAHIYSAFLSADTPDPEAVSPFTALVVSGGHTSLVRVDGMGRYTLLGQTIDDAAGEAFDKGANLLGLGYPGGPAIDRAAQKGDPRFVHFPRGRQKKRKGTTFGLDPALCFSFSGLKTALLYYLRDHPLSEDRHEVPSLAASYQEAIVDALVKRCEKAVAPGECLAVVGGVSLNSRLRARLTKLAQRKEWRLLLAEPRYCADNAAMIAGVAGRGCGIKGEEALSLDVDPNLPIGLDD